MKKLYLGLAAVFLAAAGAPAPGTLAVQPDPREYYTRTDTVLLLNGRPKRLAGMDVSWLGLFVDGALARHPTDFETHDAMQTVFQMGSGTVRSVSLGITVGCADCVIGTDGQIQPQAVRHIDHILRLAHDGGIKLIVPLIGGAGPCEPGSAVDPVRKAACGFARAHGKPDGSFFTDAELRADFLGVVTTLLNHLNPETSIAWKDDPTILAWENCDQCATAANAAAVAGWTEALGQTIRAVDQRHLYENGAFAGHLTETPVAQLAPPSVDIIGDRIMPHPGAAPDGFVAAMQIVNQTHRVYVIDGYGWSPSTWSTVADFQAFNDAMVENRGLAAALLQSLSGHADRGGYLPVPLGDDPVLFYPGAAADGIDAATMQARARVVRRLSYRMFEMAVPTFSITPAPEILSAVHGKVSWRGAAGATAYSISRSTDILRGGSWVTLCDECLNDAVPVWQDPAPLAGRAWYRITSFNANDHIGEPSAPFANQ